MRIIDASVELVMTSGSVHNLLSIIYARLDLCCAESLCLLSDSFSHRDGNHELRHRATVRYTGTQVHTRRHCEPVNFIWCNVELSLIFYPNCFMLYFFQ